jgi:FkbM family methyltransferase
LIEAAVSEADSDTLELLYYPHMTGHSTCAPEAQAHQLLALNPAVIDELNRDSHRIRVQAMTLNQICTFTREQRPTWPHNSKGLIVSLLKIDVEGLEMNCLQSMDREQWQNVRQVVVETDALTLADNSSNLDSVLLFLQQVGFESIEAVRHPLIPTGHIQMVYASRIT